MTTPSSTQAQLAERFLELHHGTSPLLMPNAWDAGSAKLLASLGFAALATTSSGFAATLGQLDCTITRDEALANSAELVAAVDLPVSADLENLYADDLEGVAQTVRLAIETGLAGCSIEDYTGRADEPIYSLELAKERVAAAAAAAHAGPVHLVLTARAENHLRGNPDLADTIARLQAYQEAGADVLYAPSITKLADLRSLVTSVDRPVNVLALPGVPSVGDLASIGVARVSVGGAFAFAALGALAKGRPRTAQARHLRVLAASPPRLSSSESRLRRLAPPPPPDPTPPRLARSRPGPAARPGPLRADGENWSRGCTGLRGMRATDSPQLPRSAPTTHKTVEQLRRTPAPPKPSPGHGGFSSPVR